jgi:NADH:ubiquinone oxidoreductase subunit 6 (subunit J)
MGFHLDMIYNGLLLVKILLALAVFYLTAALAGRSARAEKMRQREVYWLNVLVVLMLLIVLIAGYMKISSTNFGKKVKEVAAKIESYESLGGQGDGPGYKSAGLPAENCNIA